MLLPALAGAAEIRLTDIAGRQVTLPETPRRILLGDGHLLVALALVHPDPTSLVVASQGDLKRHSPAIWERFRSANPKALDAVSIVGEANADTFSVEAALAAAPDLAILAGTYGPSQNSKEVIGKLEAAGVPIVFVDFYAEPLTNTAPSVRILGQVLGRAEAGEAFATFYERKLRFVQDRVATVLAGKRPSVLLQAFGGAWDCCWLPGHAGLGEFVDAAGGHNLGDDLFGRKQWGQASREYVLAAEPDLYVTTGNPHMAASGGAVLGPGVDGMLASGSFRAALRKGAAADLASVRNGRAFGLWHLFQGLPLNIVAVEALARWTHPHLFADLKPAATIDEINARFLSVPLPGTYLVDALP